MNRPVPETLDETIDRVAAALTAVPADSGFSARLAPRLEGRARGSTSWLVAAAAAAAIVLAMLLVKPEPSTVRPVQQANAPQRTVVETASTGAARETTSPETAAPVTATPVLAKASQDEEHAPIERAPAIAALGPLETLAVDDLTLHELTIAPVDVMHLDIETLAVPEIGTIDDPKE